MTISYIVCTKNNNYECVSTCNSIIRILRPTDELIIVSGSSKDNHEDLKNYHLTNWNQRNIRLSWSRPIGIYNAINVGIAQSSSEWINVFHSGDLVLLDNNISHLWSVLNSCKKPIVIFDQLYGPTLDKASRLRSIKHPNAYPHQSIFYKSVLHQEFGYYDELSYTNGDYKFFSKATMKYNPHYNDLIYCFYNTLGVSSKFSIKLMKIELKEANGFFGVVIVIFKAAIKAILGIMGDNAIHFVRKLKNNIKENI